MSNHEIIDNFLTKSDFDMLYNQIYTDSIPWYYTSPIAFDSSISDDFYFAHSIYGDKSPQSDLFGLFTPVLNALDVKALIRIKINLYTRTQKLIKHEKHVDYSYEHKGALLFLNDNNGVTTLDDETEVESVANRVLLFDPSKPHCSSSCTDAPRRLTVNFNFF